MSLRAVIFDYGMVLSAPAEAAAHQQLVRIFGAPAETFEKQYWVHRRAYDEGVFNGDSYWRACAEDSGVSLTPIQISELIQWDIRMWTHLNQPMVNWALEVHAAGFRTGILSNIGEELALALMRFDWVRGFDHNTWSYQLRMSKPDPAIYHHALDGLGASAAETLFLDDREENILAAQAVGMQAARFRDIPDLQRDLETLQLADALPRLPVEQAA